MRNSGNCIKTCWRPAVVAGAPRPAAHHRPTAERLKLEGQIRPLLVLQRGGDDGLLAVANLTTQNLSMAALELGGRKVLLSTEDARYGGSRNIAPLSFGRGAGGEGAGRGMQDLQESLFSTSGPHPNPLPKGEGTALQILPYELLIFDGGGGRP